MGRSLPQIGVCNYWKFVGNAGGDEAVAGDAPGLLPGGVLGSGERQEGKVVLEETAESDSFVQGGVVGDSFKTADDAETARRVAIKVDSRKPRGVQQGEEHIADRLLDLGVLFHMFGEAEIVGEIVRSEPVPD